jgi:hypothetical protein
LLCELYGPLERLEIAEIGLGLELEDVDLV